MNHYVKPWSRTFYSACIETIFRNMAIGIIIFTLQSLFKDSSFRSRHPKIIITSAGNCIFGK